MKNIGIFFSIDQHPYFNCCLDPGTISQVHRFTCPECTQMIGLLLRERSLLGGAAAPSPAPPDLSQAPPPRSAFFSVHLPEGWSLADPYSTSAWSLVLTPALLSHENAIFELDHPISTKITFLKCVHIHIHWDLSLGNESLHMRTNHIALGDLTTVSTQLHSGSARTTPEVALERQELGTRQSSCSKHRPHCLALCLLVSVRKKGESQKSV